MSDYYDYPFREVGREHIHDITWDDIIDCGNAGYTIADAAYVLDICKSRLRKALAKRPDVRALFPAWGGEGMWIARKGYCGTRFTPSNYGKMVCEKCGQTVTKTSNSQRVCPACRREYMLAADRERHRRKHSNRLTTPMKQKMDHPWRRSV